MPEKQYKGDVQLYPHGDPKASYNVLQRVLQDPLPGTGIVLAPHNVIPGHLADPSRVRHAEQRVFKNAQQNKEARSQVRMQKDGVNSSDWTC